MQVSLFSPPTRLPSQPYLSLPSLMGFLEQGGVTTVSQRDLGIQLLERLATQLYGAGHSWEAESNRRIKSRVIGDSGYVSICLFGPSGTSTILLSAAFDAVLSFLSPLELLPPMQLKGKGQALPVFRVKR